jgi:hypothetical protein
MLQFLKLKLPNFSVMFAGHGNNILQNYCKPRFTWRLHYVVVILALLVTAWCVSNGAARHACTDRIAFCSKVFLHRCMRRQPLRIIEILFGR